MTSDTGARTGPGLGTPLAGADKTVGRRRGEPLTITETFDSTAALGAVFATAAVAAALLWLRAARRR
jgi:hypothetical protein